ncbi:MAG: hypothetical protein LBK53_08270 [Heliobacteriaceae bacterium]|jgi:hypothetical protein|nr:hypothetical protein [Heliobacteriaceae bacterium]
MVYSIQNNVAQINGTNGIYDGKITNPSVRYGRNSADSYFEYCKALSGKPVPKETADFLKNYDPKTANVLKQKMFEVYAEQLADDNLPPLDFEYRYMPSQNIDKMALLGAAFEEMGKKVSVSVQEMTDKLKQGFAGLTSDVISANSLDINKDGNIDIAEYSTTILASDMLSKNSAELDAKNITGTINKTGLYSVAAYANEKNAVNANGNLTDIYNAYNLGETQKEFLSDAGNILDIQA